MSKIKTKEFHDSTMSSASELETKLKAVIEEHFGGVPFVGEGQGEDLDRNVSDMFALSSSLQGVLTAVLVGFAASTSHLKGSSFGEELTTAIALNESIFKDYMDLVLNLMPKQDPSMMN